MIFSPAVFPRSGFSAFARYTNSAFENYTTPFSDILDRDFLIEQGLFFRQGGRVWLT